MSHQICDVPDCEAPAKWMAEGCACLDRPYYVQLCDEHATPKESHR